MVLIQEITSTSKDVENQDVSGDEINDQESADEKQDSDEEVSDSGMNKSGNHGWADAMNKILHTNKPKRKKTLVLSKAKKLCDVVKKPKEEELPFELEVDGEIKREKIVKEEPKVETKPSQRKKNQLNIRTKPSVLDKEREKMLQKIATKGVVTLFNAVKKQQTDIEEKLKECGPLERKREKVLQSVDKNSFLDVLMGGTKSIEVDKATSDVKKKEEKEEINGTWKVLSDDFGMNSSMKNWDKEDDSSENEDEDDDVNMENAEDSDSSS